MRVFHFLSAANALSDLIFRRLRVSRYADMNDPFELLAGGNIKSAAMLRTLKSFREEFNRDYGLLCFCRRPISPLLWGHYADKHRGICLSFDIPDETAMPVKYPENLLAVEYDPATQTISEDSKRALVASKYKHWEYEVEVRVQIPLKDLKPEAGSFFVPFGPDLLLREVQLGMTCELPTTPLLQFLNTHYGGQVQLYSSHLSMLRFEMTRGAIK
jgi:hypothetical protein